MNPASYLC